MLQASTASSTTLRRCWLEPVMRFERCEVGGADSDADAEDAVGSAGRLRISDDAEVDDGRARTSAVVGMADAEAGRPAWSTYAPDGPAGKIGRASCRERVS